MSDFERDLASKGEKDIVTMGSYLALRNIEPDIILSSAALRAQLTADGLSKQMHYEKRIEYLKELYLRKPKMILDVLSHQEDKHDSIFIIGHNPSFTELINLLQKENFTKLPTLGIVAIELNIDSWEDVIHCDGEIDFFIFPKQFKYYMPKQIRSSIE